MKKLGFLSVTGALCLGLSVAAFGASGPTTKVLTAKMTVSLNSVATSGACPSAGYATYAACSAGDVCECIVDPAATISGGIAGKGTAVVSLTADFSQDVPIGSGTQHVCWPIYGNADITSTLKGSPQTETMSMHLVGCDKITSNGKGTVSGGFGIEPGATNGTTGWGTVTGTENLNTHIATVTLKGQITQ